MKNTTIQALAIRYFEGRITNEEEKELYAFLQASPQHKALFRQWEQEWFSTLPAELEKDDWKELERKLEVRRLVGNVFSEEEPVRHLSLLWKRIVGYAAVAVFALSVAGGIGYWIHREPVPEEFYTVETANGERSKIILADGTSVWLNAGSKLVYTNHYNHKERSVSLTGEAYFEVTKQPGEIPFRVKTSHYDVVVKGTKFNISSYDDDDTAVTTLLEGKVNVQRSGKELSLEPGEEVAFDKETGRISLHKANAGQSKSWISGDLIYDSISLEDLAKRLSRRYDVRIELDEALNHTAEFKITLQNQESVDRVLNALARIIPVQYHREKDVIRIQKRN